METQAFEGAVTSPQGKAGTLALIMSLVVALDVVTKAWIQRTFHLYDQVDVLGSFVRFTYIHNRGAAFGIELGPHSREIFLVLSVVALVALVAMYWVTPAGDRLRLIAIALICGGAIGNLLDRIRSAQGVVDFLDMGLGNMRWPVFNVADMAVTTGAVLLALSLWRQEQGENASG